MNWARSFSQQEGNVPPVRNVEDAPLEMRRELIDVDLRNQHFGHGMAVQFNLSGSEVDFVDLNCIGSILLLRRTR